MENLLVKNVSIDGELCSVRSEGGVITEIGTNCSEENVKVLDQNGNICVPGLADCHAHIDKSHLNDNDRTIYVHGPGPVKGGLTREAKTSFTVEDIYNRAEKCVKKAIESGTLYLRTNCDVDKYDDLKGIEALLKLKRDYADKINIQVAAFAQEGVFQDDVTQKYLKEALAMGADLLGGHSATFGEREKHIDYMLKLAADNGTCVDFHLDESGAPNDYLLPYFVDKIKEYSLQGRVNAIHMCTLSALAEEELAKAIELVKSVDMTATIAPTAIATRQLAPVKRLLEAGITVGIGSDNIRDFFNPLGSGDVKQMALLLSYLQAFYTTEETQDIWNMITSAGAAVQGQSYGLKVGQKADLTVFAASCPREVLANMLQPSLIIRSGSII